MTDLPEKNGPIFALYRLIMYPNCFVGVVNPFEVKDLGHKVET